MAIDPTMIVVTLAIPRTKSMPFALFLKTTSESFLRFGIARMTFNTLKMRKILPYLRILMLGMLETRSIQPYLRYSFRFLEKVTLNKKSHMKTRQRAKSTLEMMIEF